MLMTMQQWEIAVKNALCKKLKLQINYYLSSDKVIFENQINMVVNSIRSKNKGLNFIKNFSMFKNFQYLKTLKNIIFKIYNNFRYDKN